MKKFTWSQDLQVLRAWNEAHDTLQMYCTVYFYEEMAKPEPGKPGFERWPAIRYFREGYAKAKWGIVL